MVSVELGGKRGKLQRMGIGHTRRKTNFTARAECTCTFLFAEASIARISNDRGNQKQHPPARRGPTIEKRGGGA